MNRTLAAAIALAAAWTALPQTAGAQTRISRAERDSLMELAETRRYQERYDEAIGIYERLGGEAARLEMASTYLEKGKVLIALEQAKAMRHDDLFSRKDDALLIEAQCRQAQGFSKAANRIYRRLHKKGHAKGIYFYANKMYAEGHDRKAETLCQEAIRRDRSIAPAHRLMAAIEVSLGHRYRALLPLYFYMLTCSDEGREEGLPQLRSLWRREAGFVYTLQKERENDPFNDLMDRRMAQLVESADYKPGESGEMEKVAQMTDSLFAYADSHGQENLDFWQVQYADFFCQLHRNGYTAAMAHFVLSPADKGAALAWLTANGRLFDEFRAWLASQIGERK